MDNKKLTENTTGDAQRRLVEQALSGDKQALWELLADVQDMIFNLSLRMLGTVCDAQDATQDILLRIMEALPSFRKESAFSTWVYKITVNYLKSYKKSMFAQRPLSFDFYGEDILNGKTSGLSDPVQEADRPVLAEELKLSCTNVMLQCLDADSRCIFVLGTMFRVDSSVASEALGLSPQAYRQRLCRARKKMAEFLKSYCGAERGAGVCNCGKRVDYAIESHRLDPANLEYSVLKESGRPIVAQCKEAMELLDGLSTVFDRLPRYAAPEKTKQLLSKLLQTKAMQTVKNS